MSSRRVRTPSQLESTTSSRFFFFVLFVALCKSCSLGAAFRRRDIWLGAGAVELGRVHTYIYILRIDTYAREPKGAPVVVVGPCLSSRRKKVSPAFCWRCDAGSTERPSILFAADTCGSKRGDITGRLVSSAYLLFGAIGISCL